MFFSKSRVGLSVGPAHISVVKASRRGEWVEVKQSALERVEEGVCRLSPIEKNIIDIDRWKGHLQAVLNRFPGTRTLSLSLPDSAVRVLLLELQQLPPGRKDFEKLIQWHMEKRFLNPLGESRFSYQLLSRESSRYKVLATAVKKEVIEQYERMDGTASIEVVSVGLASFYSVNLFQRFIVRTIGPSGHFVFVHLLDQTLTILIFEGGLLSFIRVKEWTRQGASSEGTEGDPGDVLYHEIGAALSFYEGGGKTQSNLTHLFLSLDLPVFDVGMIQENFRLTPVVLDPSEMIRLPRASQDPFPAGSIDPADSMARRAVVAAAAAAVGGVP